MNMIHTMLNKRETKSYKLWGSFASFLAVLTLGGLSGTTLKAANAKAPLTLNSAETPSFDGETALDTSSLSVSAIRSTETEYGASYSIEFSTGGDALVDTEANYNVVGYSDDLMEYHNVIISKTAQEREEMKDKIRQGLATSPEFSGYIYNFYDLKTSITVPQTLSRGEFDDAPLYIVNVDSIRSHALSDKSNATEISIPNTITSIPADAFELAPKLETIYVNCSESEKPAGWEAGWNAGATVVWESDIYSDPTKHLDHMTTISTTAVGNADINYIIGYFPSDGTTQYPLVLEYEIEGSSEKHYLNVPKTSTSIVEYDGVGKGIHGFKNELFINVDVNRGEKIVYNSIVLHNIFSAERFTIEGVTSYKPILSKRFFTKPVKKYATALTLNDFLTTSFKGVSSFNGYSSVNLEMNKVDGGAIFKSLKPSIYAEHEAALKSGNAYIRYRFTSLGTSSFRVKQNGVETILPIKTPIQQFILEKNSTSISFVINNGDIPGGFNANSLESFAMNNVSLTLDIVLNGTILSRTATPTRFGCIFFLTDASSVNVFDANKLVGFIALGYAVLAALVSIVLFFVYKEVYKNDEFRRLKPKKFIKKSFIYGLTSLVLVLFITFVTLRLTIFNNTIVVYNPLDLFIVFFGIATVIIVGYYVKNLVGYIKTVKKARRDNKLGINKDVIKDGTN